jgi:sec-independent protein translocase protein TatA
MGGFSWIHWLVVGIVLLLLFGKGRFSEMMGDVAKGIKNFKKGMTEEEEVAAAQAEQQRRLDARAPQPTVITPQAGDVTPEPTAVSPAPTATDGTQR